MIRRFFPFSLFVLVFLFSFFFFFYCWLFPPVVTFVHDLNRVFVVERDCFDTTRYAGIKKTNANPTFRDDNFHSRITAAYQTFVIESRASPSFVPVRPAIVLALKGGYKTIDIE